MKFGKKSERALADLRERTADTLFSDLGTVALVIESSDLSITEDNFVPTARCIQDTKKRQLVTRSSLHGLRCCECHLHHEQAMRAPYLVRQFFAKVLKKEQRVSHLHHEQAMRAPYRVRQFFAKLLRKVQHYRVDVLAGDANAAAYKYF